MKMMRRTRRAAAWPKEAVCGLWRRGEESLSGVSFLTAGTHFELYLSGSQAPAPIRCGTALDGSGPGEPGQEDSVPSLARGPWRL